MLQYIREARRSESGFTLIELLMVVVILGILSGIVVFAVGGITDKGQTAACKAEYKTIQVAEEAYYATGGSKYASSDDLVTAKLLGSTPKLFKATYDSAANTYTIAPATGSACTVAMATA